uniref:hypothetical protein n=1 Tax=Sphingomonas sp. TaxID=28214 RepID=UPI0025E67ED4|nr:hypothetical protein [Sphingomonas sp.]
MEYGIGMTFARNAGVIKKGELKMSLRSKVVTAAIVACSFASSSAYAASYVVTNSLPFYNTIGCKNASTTGAFSTGTVVSSGSYTGNCSGGYTVALDTVAKTITLSGFQNGDYQLNNLNITGITEANITGLSLVSLGGLFTTPRNYVLPTTQTSFTGNSLGITFSTNTATDQEFYYTTYGRAVFAYTTGAVPETATWGMMVAGFAMMGAAMRTRRRTAKVTFA